MDPLEQQIVDFVVSHSPPDSGWVYLALADNWPIVHPALTAIWCVVLIASLTVFVEWFRE
jgi:hypothetical protein